MLSLIVNEWPSHFTEKFQHHFPPTYMAVDCEFTGSNAATDLIFEIGHVLVVDGAQVDCGSVILDWTRHPGVDQNWLKYKFDNLRGHMGPSWPFSWERLRAEGVDPQKALEQYATLLAVWKRQDLPFAAHNGITADERLLRAMFERYLRRSNFRFSDNGYFDTGGIFKASLMLSRKLGDCVVIFPQPTDTLKTYFQRVVHHPVKGVMWSMKALSDHFDFKSRFPVDEDRQHTAAYDALCVHWAMEEFRSLIYRNNSGESAVDSGAAMERAFNADLARKKIEATINAPDPAPVPVTPVRGQLRRVRQRPI